MEIDGIVKIFMIGDLHYGIRNNSVVWKNDMIEFMDKFIEDLPDHGFNEDTDILMLTGDTFHSREFLNVMIVHEVVNLFERLAKKFKRGIFTILGNHDQYYKRSAAVHTMKVMSQLFSNMHVFTEAEPLTINGNVRFLMLPWHDDLPVLDSAMASNPGADYLFSHIDIQDFKYNKSARVDKGIEQASLKRFKRVYNGHLHHKQEQGNTLCIGSPYQMDSGDSETPRGYYVVRIADDMLSEEYFENASSPRFVSYEFDDLMNMGFDRLAEVMGKNYVSVHIPCSAARNFSYAAFSELLAYRKIAPRKLEFKQYEDSYGIDDTKFDATSDFNLAVTAKSILEEKKYSHSETENVLAYFNQLHTRARSNEKDTVK